ncbi:hypothetical protein [Tateyamaria sp.]|uniref:hypothetical protein n=1 Tax=Tateyamaria sp. TaxID=1929288 RepID=UPI00329F0242
MRALRELHLLPYFPAPARHGYRSKKSVRKTVLTRFLKTYQTVATATRHLDIEEKELRSKVDEVGILPEKEGAGLPIYYRPDLLDQNLTNKLAKTCRLEPLFLCLLASQCPVLPGRNFVSKWMFPKVCLFIKMLKFPQTPTFTGRHTKADYWKQLI